MRSTENKNQQGISLVEVVIAIALFGIMVLGVSYMVVGASDTARQSVERKKATLLAREGLEAVHNMYDAGFSNLASGSYGLELSGGVWTLVPDTPDVTDDFTRTIIIEQPELYRRHVISTVSWSFSDVRDAEVSLDEYFSDWRNAAYVGGGGYGDCGEAEALGIEIGEVRLETENFKDLLGIQLRNISQDPITIARMTPYWDLPVRRIKSVTIDTHLVWLFNGIGTPDNKQPSGVTLDIDDHTLYPGEGWVNSDFLFDGPMTGTDFTIVFIMSDGCQAQIFIEEEDLLDGPSGEVINQNEALVVDASGVQLASNSTIVTDMYMENTASQSISITELLPAWNPIGCGSIRDVQIADTSIWSEVGPGSPFGAQLSSVSLDIRDTVLIGGTRAKFSNTFTTNVSGCTFDYNFLMGDGTTYQKSDITP